MDKRRYRRRHRLNLPAKEAAVWIIRRLRQEGFQALLAGGCVRDLLLGRTPKDYDVATNARPEQILRIFRRTLKVGVQFGVVMVGDAGPWIEVATFRSDLGYSDGRHPDAVTYGTAEQDALRRDFTINGLFLDPLENRIIDFVGGQADLQRRIVRAIGDARERFAEDHLRILRAVRFAATLNFRIEPATWRAAIENGHLLVRVSRERILEELQRIFENPGRAVAFRLMWQCGLLHRALPVTDDRPWPPARVELACKRLSCLPAECDFACCMAAALADWHERTIDDLCRNITCSNELRKRITWLVGALPAARDAERLSLADLKRLMANRDFENLKRLLRADLAARHLPLKAWEVLDSRARSVHPAAVQPAPLVRGDDLIAMGVPAGPIYKDVLDAVYTAQLNEQIHTREEALKLTRRLLNERGFPVPE